MTTKVSELSTISCMPGVEPDTDKTTLATKHYTFSDRIRFVNGVPEKIGGWTDVVISNDLTIMGAARAVFSITINGRVYTLIGTEKKLYVLIGSTLINITPLEVTTTAIANSLDTHYNTLANNPLTSVNGSSTLTVADTDAARYVPGDIIKLSGATGFAGILAAAINTQHIVRTVGVNSYTINVGTLANSSTSGGGAAVVRTSGVVTVNAAAHGQANGDRVKIAGAAAFGGITAPQINMEHIIRNVGTNAFDVVTDGFATSSVTSAGGAATTYAKEIADGNLNASFGQGYGMGLYGAGLYGVSKLSSTGVVFPRIWFMDGYGENVILTPGNQTGLYQWDGDTEFAPVLVSGAPTAINYSFVSNNIVITFGASNIGNHIFASDINDYTEWTASSVNQVFEDFIEGAGRLLSHVEAAGTNLIFTDTQTYSFRYIGLPLIWEIKQKSAAIGIIAPMARCTVNDVAYWMGNDNFYMWNGGNIEIIPSNSDKQSTILNYVFKNINTSQKSKCFAWYNKQFNEVWFHYPSAASLECDRIARVSLYDYNWVPDTMSRAGAEYPDILLNQPRLSQYDSGFSTLFRHEVGNDDGYSPMSWSLTSNFRTATKETVTDVGIIPDSFQSGNINLNYKGYLFPQSTATTFDKNYTVTPTSERISTTLNGRFFKYTWSGSELGQAWRMGMWQDYLQGGATN